MDMPLVSVIIPCYNAATWLRETFASARAQNGVRLQVIVVDDGSTDGSGELVAREFPEVELVRTTNRGVCAARNLGLSRARGEVIQFLDADDVLSPNKLAQQYAQLQATGADVVYGDWQYLMPQADGTYLPGRVVANELQGIPELEIFKGFWAPTCAYLFRREIVQQVEGFNETLPIVQDARFVQDCAHAGARFAYLAGVAGFYRVHNRQLSGQRKAFVRDCLTNATQVAARWRSEGTLTAEQQAALMQVYANIARMSYDIDPVTFAETYKTLLQLDPHFIPAAPASLALTTRLVGYPRAEAVAKVYRQIKRAAQSVLGRAPSDPLPLDAVPFRH